MARKAMWQGMHHEKPSRRLRLDRLLSMIALMVLLPQCSPTDVLNAITPTQSIKAVETTAYGPQKRQMLDLYTPTTPKPDTPVIVFFYGGSWDSGEKGDYKFVAEAFTSAGYTVAVPDYRVYPNVIFPAFVEDAALAVALVHQRFPNRAIAIIGHSAGGHIALMLALETRYLGTVGVERCDMVNAAIALSAPVGIVPLKREPYISIFPNRMTGKDAPLNNVSANVPPILMVTGLNDTTVLPANAITMTDALKNAGADVSLFTYADLDHVDTVKFLASFFADHSPLKGDIFAFLTKNGRQSAPFCNGDDAH